MIRKFLKKDKNNIYWLASFYAAAFLLVQTFLLLAGFIDSI
jgi:hypothetical protein